MSQNSNDSASKGANQSNPNQGGDMGKKPMEQGAGNQRDTSKQMDQSGADTRQQGADQTQKDAQRSDASRRAQEGATGQQGDQGKSRNQ